jgi:hypothetical protein
MIAHRSRRQRPAAPLCPVCGNRAQLSPGQFGTRAACCGLWSWGLKPLADRETHAARIRAHQAFDRLWRGGSTLSRDEAYRRLALAMGMSRRACHIAQMSEAQALRVVVIVRAGLLAEGNPP